MKPAAFLFDLDGTLLDTEALWAEAIVEWLADRGAKAAVDEIAPVVFGHSWLDIQATLHERFPALPKTGPEEDAKTLRPYYARRAVNPESQIIPGAVSFLKTSCAGWRTSCASCWARRTTAAASPPPTAT